MCTNTLILLLISLFLLQCNSQKQFSGTPSNPETVEIFYHICQRSFYDSNGDLHGDLKGLEQKLDYLQELGVTSILLLPLYESDYYHNYFPNDFEKIDAEFGMLADYLSLVQAIHDRGLKLYMDMEIQYVTEHHLWFKDSSGNTASPYSDYLIYNGPGNTEPESIVFDLYQLESYDGTIDSITTLNLHNPELQVYFHELFKYWVDPNGDGNFKDGVDGFRIDHMMDDLDWKGKFTNLFADFWKPLFDSVKSVNPDLKIIGEQANWGSYGQEYFAGTDLDMVFAFGLKFAIEAMDKQQIINKADSTFLFTPDGKDQLVFLENHDTDRFASKMQGHLPKLKVGAALNLLLKGTPLIYYGQEIGMEGTGGFGYYGNTDANDIPRREAFEWQSTVKSPGHALWYKDTGPWWDQTNLADNDGISVEEQEGDPASLLNYYKKLIELRKSHPALAKGAQHFIDQTNEAVVAFVRSQMDDQLLVVVNLSNEEQRFQLSGDQFTQWFPKSRPLKDLLSDQEVRATPALNIVLAPFQVLLLTP